MIYEETSSIIPLNGVAATAALALSTASSARALARSDALIMTSETSTDSSETGTEEEGATPAEADEEIEESPSDVVFAFCKIFHQAAF